MFQNFKHPIACIAMQKYRSEFNKTRHFQRKAPFSGRGLAVSRPLHHRSRIRYLSKKIANFKQFSEIKKIRKNSYKNSLNAECRAEFDAFHGFILIKNIKQTYKGDLHFTVICCTNTRIINERYIPEHQNKLNIYDLQNYEFFCEFFSTEKNSLNIKNEKNS